MKKCIPNSRVKYEHEKGWGAEGMVYFREFQPEDMMPYYDIYDNGKIYFYVKQNKKFLWWEWEVIWKLSDDMIELIEIPVKKECYRERTTWQKYDKTTSFI